MSTIYELPLYDISLGIIIFVPVVIFLTAALLGLVEYNSYVIPSTSTSYADAEIDMKTLRMSVVINVVNLFFIMFSRHIFQPRGLVLAFCYTIFNSKFLIGCPICGRDFTLCKSVFHCGCPAVGRSYIK